MEQTTGQLCNLCLTYTCQENPMRTIPTCKHSLCAGCLDDILAKHTTVPIKLRCPFDELESTFYSKDFSNPAYLQSVSRIAETRKSLFSKIQKTVETEDGEERPTSICLQHKQPTALWCHEDRRLVCPKCALFDHAQHQVEPFDESRYERYECSKELLSLLQSKQSLTAQANDDTLRRETRREFEAKRKTVVKDIKKWFMGLFEMLAEAEKNCFDKVDRCFKRIQQKYMARLNVNPSISEEMELWEEAVMRQLKVYQQTENKQENNVGLLIQHMKLAASGESIVERLSNHVSEAKSSKLHIKDCITISFSTKLEGLVKNLPQTLFRQSLGPPAESIKDVYDNVKRQKTMQNDSIMISPNDDEQLLQGIEPQPKVQSQILSKPNLQDTLNMNESFRNVARSPSIASFHGDKQLLNISLNNVTGFCQLKNSRSMISLRKSSISNTTKRSTIETTRSPRNGTIDKNNPLRKLAQISLPEKYKRQADELTQNKLLVLDLSNCELDTHGLNHMLELAQDCIKLRTIKLIKCRLTDATIEQLWRYFKQTTTLNLSQNHLSDKTIDSLLVAKPLMVNLRSVVLSQNLIKERVVRQRLEELGKLGLSVTL